jgi:ABC-2 type transport system permease protein
MSLPAAFLRRDFRLQRSYRLQFLAQLLGPLLSLVSFVFLARLVPNGQTSLRPYGSDYFTFVLVGSGIAAFFSTGLVSFSDTLGREQATGTLEALLVTPNDPRMLLAAGALWPFCFSAVQLAVYFLAGLTVLGARISLGNLALVAVILALSLIAFSGLGLLAAAVLIQTKRAVIMVGMVGAAFAILGGVMYPVSVLPHWLQGLAHLLPITYGLDAVRLSLMASPNLATIARDSLALIGFSIILLPGSLVLFGWSVDRARREGTLAHY